MALRKDHIPAPGKAEGLQGVSLCGQWGHFRSGDHDLLRRLAIANFHAGSADCYCTWCLRKLVEPAS